MKYASVDELLDVLGKIEAGSEDPYRNRIIYLHRTNLLEAMNAVAEFIARELEVGWEEAEDRGEAYGGLLVKFKPLTENQPCPPLLEDVDDSGTWEPGHED